VAALLLVMSSALMALGEQVGLGMGKSGKSTENLLETSETYRNHGF